MNPRLRRKRSPNQTQLNTDIDKTLMSEVNRFIRTEKLTKRLVVETALRRFLVSEAARKAEERMKAKTK